ncbi:MAG: hypothetical protein R2731_12285 [Nocardioides sp.]
MAITKAQQANRQVGSCAISTQVVQTDRGTVTAYVYDSDTVVRALWVAQTGDGLDLFTVWGTDTAPDEGVQRRVAVALMSGLVADPDLVP